MNQLPKSVPETGKSRYNSCCVTGLLQAHVVR